MLFKNGILIFCIAVAQLFTNCLLSAQALVFQSIVQNSTLLPGQRYVIFSYNFINKGRDVIKIGKVELTCGCSSHELDKQVIAPEESGVITLKVDTIGRSGRWEIGAAIETDEKGGLYMIRGTITKSEYMTVTPRMLRWQIGDEMKEKRLVVTLKILDEKQIPFSEKNIIVNQGQFDVRVELVESSIEKGRRYFVYVRPKRKEKSGDMIRIKIDPDGSSRGFSVIAYVGEKRDKL